MKKALVVLLLCAGVVGGGRYAWQEGYIGGPSFDDYFTGGAGELVRTDLFEARFPAEPGRDTVEVDAGDGIRFDMAVHETGDRTHTFAVGAAVLPPGFIPEGAAIDEALEAGARAAAEVDDGEVLTWVHKQHLGREALEFTVRVDGRYLKATALLDRERMYVLMVGDKRNPPRSYERFVHSVKIP